MPWRPRIFGSCHRIVAGAMVAAFAVGLAGPSRAKPVCGDRAAIVAKLAKLYKERPAALGISASGGLVELLTSPKGGWTLLFTTPGRPTCIIAVGHAWESFPVIRAGSET